jgi:hypothetical protein
VNDVDRALGLDARERQLRPLRELLCEQCPDELGVDVELVVVDARHQPKP